MNSTNNKLTIQALYQKFLNQKDFGILDKFLDKDYSERFKESNMPLLNAFPNIQFNLKEIFVDNDKVITIYDWTGTHENEYQQISATHKKITVEGISIYEFRNGKIVNSIAKPDKLSFFLQLGVIPSNFKSKISL